MSEDLADVVAAAAEDGEKRIAECTFQKAAHEPSVGLHVADLGLDAAAPPERLRQRRGQPAASAADQGLSEVPAARNTRMPFLGPIMRLPANGSVARGGRRQTLDPAQASAVHEHDLDRYGRRGNRRDAVLGCRLDRQEPGLLRQAFAPPPELGPPLVDVLPGQVMTTGDICNPRPIHTNLRQDRPLLRIRPATSPLDARQTLLPHNTIRHRRCQSRQLARRRTKASEGGHNRVLPIGPVLGERRA